LLSALLSPDRWLLWLGLLFVLSVYYFPTGVVGRLRTRAALKRWSKKPGLEETV
jgi:branched-chain amino acid transport system permease protein